MTWTVRVPYRVDRQIRNAPKPVAARALWWTELRDGLRTHPFGTDDLYVDPIRDAQRKNASGQHVRIGGPWRLIYVVLPKEHRVVVYDCVPHVNDSLYSRAYIKRMLTFARKNPWRSP